MEILGNFNEYYAKEIFCEAYKLEMYGRRYQWIIMGTYSPEWWKKLHPDLNCTIDEIESALEQTILTDLLPLSTSGEITISGIVSLLKASLKVLYIVLAFFGGREIIWLRLAQSLSILYRLFLNSMLIFKGVLFGSIFWKKLYLNICPKSPKFWTTEC